MFQDENKRNSARRLLLTTAVVLLSSLAFPSFAQSRYADDAVGYIGIRGGYLELEKVDEDGSFTWGLFGGAFLNRYIALEVSVDHQQTDLVFQGDDWAVVVPLVERETTALQAGLKWTPVSRGPIRPFLSGGVGYYMSEYTAYDGYEYRYDTERIDEGGTYLGCGLDLFGHGSNRRGFAMTWDFRRLFTEAEPYGDTRIRADGWISTVGCSFKF